MQTAKAGTPRRSQTPKRSFTWDIKTTDIEFMRAGADAAMEGSGSGDCSQISDFDPLQHRKPAPAARR